MNRSKPLKRSSLRSSSSLSKGKPKRTRRRKVSMAGFWAAVTEDGTKPCALADPDYIECPVLTLKPGTCWGRITAHHWILEQRLPPAAKTDPRVGVPLCFGHHQAVHRSVGPLPCPRPPDLDSFLADHGLLESGRPDPKRREAA